MQNLQRNMNDLNNIIQEEIKSNIIIESIINQDILLIYEESELKDEYSKHLDETVFKLNSELQIIEKEEMSQELEKDKGLYHAELQKIT